MSPGLLFQLKLRPAWHLPSNNPPKGNTLRKKHYNFVMGINIHQNQSKSSKPNIFPLCNQVWPFWRKELLDFPTSTWKGQKWKLMTKGTTKIWSSLDLETGLSSLQLPNSLLAFTHANVCNKFIYSTINFKKHLFSTVNDSSSLCFAIVPLFAWPLVQ